MGLALTWLSPSALTGRAGGLVAATPTPSGAAEDWSQFYDVTITVDGSECSLDMALQAAATLTESDGCPAGSAQGTRLLLAPSGTESGDVYAFDLELEHEISGMPNLVIESEGPPTMIAPHDDGAIICTGTALRVRNIRFNGNAFDVHFHDFEAMNPVVSSDTGATLSNVSFASLRRQYAVARFFGGAQLDGLTFRDNHASIAPLWIGPGVSRISDSRFVMNQGGSSRPQTTESDMTSGGGAVRISGFDNLPTEVEIVDTEFSANRSHGTAGALHAWGDNTDVTVTNAIFSANRTETTYHDEDHDHDSVGPSGGAIHVEFGANLSVADSAFLGNGAGIGGALTVFNATAQLRRTKFHANMATYIGGALAAGLDSTLDVQDCLFRDGWAQIGGAAVLGIGLDARFDRTTFESNGAQMAAGAIAAWSGESDDEESLTTSLEFTNTVFQENSVEISGLPSEVFGVIGDVQLRMNHVTMVNRPEAVGAALGIATTASAIINNSIFVSENTPICPGAGAFSMFGPDLPEFQKPVFATSVLQGDILDCTAEDSSVSADAQLLAYGQQHSGAWPSFSVAESSPALGLSNCLKAEGVTLTVDHAGYPRLGPCTAGAFQIASPNLSRTIALAAAPECDGFAGTKTEFGVDSNEDGVLEDDEVEGHQPIQCERTAAGALVDALAEAETLRGERDSLQGSLTEAQTQLAAAESAHAALQADLDEAQALVQRLQADLEEAQASHTAEVAALTASLEAALAQQASLESELADAERAIAERDAALAGAQAELANLREALRQAAPAADAPLETEQPPISESQPALPAIELSDIEFDARRLRIGELTEQCIADNGRVRGIGEETVVEDLTLDCQILAVEPQTIQQPEGCACQ